MLTAGHHSPATDGPTVISSLWHQLVSGVHPPNCCCRSFNAYAVGLRSQLIRQVHWLVINCRLVMMDGRWMACFTPLVSSHSRSSDDMSRVQSIHSLFLQCVASVSSIARRSSRATRMTCHAAIRRVASRRDASFLVFERAVRMSLLVRRLSPFARARFDDDRCISPRSFVMSLIARDSSPVVHDLLGRSRRHRAPHCMLQVASLRRSSRHIAHVRCAWFVRASPLGGLLFGLDSGLGFGLFSLISWLASAVRRLTVVHGLPSLVSYRE